MHSLAKCSLGVGDKENKPISPDFLVTYESAGIMRTKNRPL